MTVYDLTAMQLRQAHAAGELSAVAITEAFLERIRQQEPIIQAFLHVDETEAIRQAEAVDAKRRSGQPVGLLAGIPVGIKDLLCVRGTPTTCASRMLASYHPPYDATVIQRLRAADAILIGKTNLDEFAMGSSTETSAFRPTRNPWNPECNPGGSSGGSAAAVAAREAPLAIGTDTGGSIRQPASFCGIVGLKPTYGRVSRYGMVAFASSLDQIGPMARTVADTALLLEVIAGHDPRDSTSVPRPVPRYTERLTMPPQPLRIGLPREFFELPGLDREVEAATRAALQEFVARGATLVEVSLPHAADYAVAVYYLVATAEASSNLARYDGMHYGHRTAIAGDLATTMSRSRAEAFGPEVKRRIMLGTYALSSGYYDAYYLKALKVRRLIAQEFAEAFSRCDLIAGPTSPTPAFPIGSKVNDPLAMYLSDIYTISANLVGIPGLSLPCGFSRCGLPIGLQLLAPHFAEETLLQAGHLYEQVTDWHRRCPPDPKRMTGTSPNLDSPPSALE